MMRHLVKIIIVLLMIDLFSGLASCSGPSGKEIATSANPALLRALIITGQCKSYHDWKTSSSILKQLLEQTGLFKVDIAITPPHNGEMEDFQPNFTDYHVVVIDYEGDSWPEQTKTAFVKYVKSGGGVVIYHAASWNFYDWDEYGKIIGLRFKSDGDEKLGPYIRWRDDKIVRDYSSGPAGSEVADHQFQIVVRNYEHPVIKGLPKKWLHVKEGLYTKLRGPAENLTILATAYADPNLRCKGNDNNYGSGEHEPVLFTINYGKGRIFHTVLGHISPKKNRRPRLIDATQCVDFIVTFQRGAEWAATGKVTQKVPDDFPTETNIRMRRYHEQPASDETMAKEKVEFIRGDDKIDVKIGGRDFTSYFYGGKFYKIIKGNTGIGGFDGGYLAKPILFPINTPSGIVVTRGYPLIEIADESKDHPGLPGIVFAYGGVNGLNFWDNSTDEFEIKHIKVVKMESGREKGVLSIIAHWIDTKGQILLEEKRDMVFHGGNDEYAIDFDIILTAKDTKVCFRDEKQGLLQIRVSDWLREPIESEWMKTRMPGCTGNGKYFNSNGDEFEKGVWGKRAKWVCLEGEKDGKSAGIVIFDHPKSVNYPSYWMTRAYGMFAVNPLGQGDFEKYRGNKRARRFNLALEPGQSAYFKYRMIIYDGSRTKEQLEQQHREFVKSP